MATQLQITFEPVCPQGAIEAFMHGRRHVGALASFVGYCRDHSHGRSATQLVLEHYPGFTEREIERFASPVAQRHGLIDLLVIHRVGALSPGDAIVLVAALSSHRAQAFAAVETLMDFLKTDAPFWKREHGPDGARWIEPTPDDRARRARHKDLT